MKRGPKPGDESMAGGTRHKYTYDAWNRLVKIETWDWNDANEDGKVQDGEVQVTGTVAEYRYDPLNRRIRKFTEPSEGNWTVREYYYNNQWQNLEVRKEVKARSGTPLSEPAVAAVVCEQYIWSPRYIDAPILRDRDADGNSGTGNLGGTGSGLEERHYYTTDGNGNVTALTDTSGTAVERYVYDPYGKPTIYNADWTATVSWANSEQNEILYCGYRFDPESGLYLVRRRMYDYSLGRWLQRDPKEYVDGMSLYEYCRSCPEVLTDPLGETGNIRVVTKAHHGRSVTPGGRIPENLKDGFKKDDLKGTYVEQVQNRLKQMAPNSKVGVMVAVDSDGNVRKDKNGDIIFGIAVEQTGLQAKSGDVLLKRLVESEREVEIVYQKDFCQAEGLTNPNKGTILFDPEYKPTGYVQFWDTRTKQYYWDNFEMGATAFGHELIHQYYAEQSGFVKLGKSPEQLRVPTSGGGRKQVTSRAEFRNEEKAVVNRPDFTEGDSYRPERVDTVKGFTRTPGPKTTDISENGLRRDMRSTSLRVSYGEYSREDLDEFGIKPGVRY
jgi:RHS repeat-associated protein